MLKNKCKKMEEYGVDTLKKLILMSTKVAKKTSEALEDDDVTIIEGIGIGIPMLKAPSIWKKRKELLKEINDLSESEVIEIQNYVIDELGANEKINSWITWSFEMIKTALRIPL